MISTKKLLVSVIIPTFNEEKVIGNCLVSLGKQDYENLEIIVVDDGSSDHSLNQTQETRDMMQDKKLGDGDRKIKILTQKHLGPGAARNLGAAKAEGEILVFVDADMEFEPDFITKLVEPIVSRRTIGTFSKDEYLLNKENTYARCWNLNLGKKALKMHSDDYPDKQNVFRAVLKKKFEEVGGFDTKVGYTDDWSLARKLGEMAVVAPGARYYHRNPETLSEVWRQARWFGKSEFLTRNIIRRLYNLWRYCPILSVLKGFTGAFIFREPSYFVFKIVYDSAVFTSVVKSFLGEQKNR